MTCPSLEDLALLLEADRAGDSVLSPDGTSLHLAAGCSACDRRLVALRALDRDLRALVFEAASPATIQSIKGLAAPPSGSALAGLAGGLVDGLTAAWEELVATVLPPPAGIPAVRSASPGRTPLLFRAEGFEVDLTHLESGSLVGQVLPEDPDARGLGDGDVFLYGPECAQATELLATGEFRFASVGPDRYSLVIAAGGVRIFIPGVELESR